MFITNVRKEDICESTVKSIYKSKFHNGLDVLKCRRDIILYNDLDVNRSYYEGFHNIKCSIINTVVLDGKQHYDIKFNPEIILVKTVYNGYMVCSLESIKGSLKLSESLISKSRFRLSNVYTSYLGLWSIYEDYDTFTPIGVSILDMIYLNMATMRARNVVYMCPTEIAMKIEISFDGDNYYETLPIPYPQFYSRIHSNTNGEDPVITKNVRLDMESVCDEFTTLHKVDFTKRDITTEAADYRYESDLSSKILYYDSNWIELVRSNDDIPMHVACAALRSLSDELFGNIFKLFSRYLLSSVTFTYESISHRFLIPSMTFSFKDAPKNFASTVLMEMHDDSNINNSLTNFKILHENIKIICRLTDLRYDITIIFSQGHRDVAELKYVKYKSSVFDLVQSLTDSEVNVKKPISSFYHN